MAVLLDIFGFLAVILRGVSLSFEALLIGGSAYLLWTRSIWKNEARMPPFGGRLITVAAIGLVSVQALWLSVNSTLLQSTTGISWTSALGAGFVWAGVIQIVASLVIVRTVYMLSRSWAPFLLVSASLLLLYGSVATSHSAARLSSRALMMVVTGGHQLGAALWVGALPFLLWSLVHVESSHERFRLLSGFTRQALAGVAVLLICGLILAIVYIGSFPLIYGTTYGVMTVAKTILFGALLFLGWQNNSLIRRKMVEGNWRSRLRRFSEAEIVIGSAVILAAASLTSQPPARDTAANRVPASVIIKRFTPAVPTMRTPALADLTPVTPRSAEEARLLGSSPLDVQIPGAGPLHEDKLSDIQWSEFNHNWAGLIVLLAGSGAVLARFRWGKWARHWPLVFIGLAIFLLIRADSENWPLGPHGFWESFAIAEVAQHRFFVVLIVLFAIFEWGVQTKRIRSEKAGFVFPFVCVLGGVMLLAHNHSLTRVQEELLAELSHTPIGLLALFAGCARWLELRAPAPRWAANIWPLCFVGIGYFLLTYREH